VLVLDLVLVELVESLDLYLVLELVLVMSSTSHRISAAWGSGTVRKQYSLVGSMVGAVFR
jgi:hypothetical protein